MLRDHALYCCESPAAICENLEGKLYEVPSDTALTGQELLLSERQAGDRTVLRIASDFPVEGAVPVSPDLEDAFLYIYREDTL